MMGKAARRKREPAAQGGDIRARIANEAAQVRNAARAGIQDAKETPALCGLLDSARKAVEQSIPKSFEHEGLPTLTRVGDHAACLECVVGVRLDVRLKG